MPGPNVGSVMPSDAHTVPLTRDSERRSTRPAVGYVVSPPIVAERMPPSEPVDEVPANQKPVDVGFWVTAEENKLTAPGQLTSLYASTNRVVVSTEPSESSTATVLPAYGLYDVVAAAS